MYNILARLYIDCTPFHEVKLTKMIYSKLTPVLHIRTCTVPFFPKSLANNKDNE